MHIPVFEATWMTRPSPERALAEVERAMVAIRRSQNRRALSRLLARSTDTSLADSFVVDALERADDAAPPNIREVALRMGVDPSRASRMVSEAVARGYVQRLAVQDDARRTGLILTSAGRQLADVARSVRLQAFGHATKGWTPEELESFAHLLGRFVNGLPRG
jgi:DNA-binding MarR family transcriptional regulator